MSGPLPHRILLVRTDRIGDVVLTLPLARMLRERFPEVSVTFLVRTYTRDLVAGDPYVSDVLVLEEFSNAELLAELRRRQFDAVVHVFPRRDLVWISWRAGIPLRIGSAYRLYSLLLTHRIRDHRRAGTLHEAVLNARLLGPFGIEAPPTIRPVLTPSDAHRGGALRVRSRLGIAEGARVVAIHPGSGGSSRDWSVQNFTGLARELLRDGFRVVVTGSAEEVDLADHIVRGTGGTALSAAGEFSIMELAAFLGGVSLFISNSTGPLHIAAAVGTPVMSFFPPLAAAGVHRWGPLSDSSYTFTPDKSRCQRCLGTECKGNTCMDQITIGMAAEKAREMLSRTSMTGPGGEQSGS